MFITAKSENVGTPVLSGPANHQGLLMVGTIPNCITFTCLGFDCGSPPLVYAMVNKNSKNALRLLIAKIQDQLGMLTAHNPQGTRSGSGDLVGAAHKSVSTSQRKHRGFPRPQLVVIHEVRTHEVYRQGQDDGAKSHGNRWMNLSNKTDLKLREKESSAEDALS